MINIALPKGRLGEKVYSLLEAIGYGCPEMLDGSRKLIFENAENKVRYFWAKPSDVAIYVERGAADIGVVGKDILLEYSPDVYELCDLGFGKCRMAVEIAPLLDLSDVIVDIVETGATLRENGLEAFETICDISARLVANKAAYKFKSESINKLVARTTDYISESKK